MSAASPEHDPGSPRAPIPTDSLGPSADSARRANEAIEWLAVAWILTEPGTVQTANAHLVSRLRGCSALLREEGVDLELLARLRGRHKRDWFIKQIALAAYGDVDLVVDGEFEILLLATQLLCVKSSLRDRFRAEFEQAEKKIGPLLDGRDPGADLSRIVGEPVRVRALFVPSLFLPPPQAGRHGVKVVLEDEVVLHLHFGLPLLERPENHFLTPGTLRMGAWHYTIQHYLSQHWAPVSERLESLPGVAEAFSDGGGRDSIWPGAVRNYLVHGLKILLGAHHAGSAVEAPGTAASRTAAVRGMGLLMAEAAVAPHTEWFLDWIEASLADPRSFAERLTQLPDLLQEQVGAFAARAGGQFDPPAISLALMNGTMMGFSIVFPDSWDEQHIARLPEDWKLLGNRSVLRYSEWAQGGRQGSVVAFGSVEENPLVREILGQREVRLDPADWTDPIIINLGSVSSRDGATSWAIAVGLRSGEQLARTTATRLAAYPYAHTVLDGDEVVHKTLDPRLPIDPRDPRLRPGS